MRRMAFLCCATLVSLASSARAQSNTIPGTDVQLGILGGIAFAGSSGTTNALSMSTTSCNPGSVEVPWEAPMAENHPMIGFMIAREEPGNGRFVQISDWSWLKHTFFALSSNQCSLGCAGTDGSKLGVGCSDTYGSGLNSSRFYLGPPSEIDPWLGTWTAQGSYFDCGDASGPCDGVRSYMGAASTAVEHRTQVEDADLGIAGADYFYYGYYVIRAEPEANRENNGTSRPFNVSPSGGSWNVSAAGPQLDGTVLQRWTGATIVSDTNGSSDGRCYVGYKVTGGPGAWHYEYAVHNRDNAGGISEFRLPLGLGTDISAMGFHDIDQDAGNQWTMQIVGNEIVFETPDNPLTWNSVFNFWFDSAAAPASRTLNLVQFGALHGGDPSIDLVVQAPGDGPGELSFVDTCNGDGGNQTGCTNCPCGNEMPVGTIGGCRNSALSGARLMGSGSPSVGSDSTRFELTGAPPTSFCILTSGDSVAPSTAANPCFGLHTGVQAVAFDGLRCAVGNTLRHGGRSADSNGDIGVTNAGWGGVDGPPIGLVAQGGFAAGQTRHFQVINRESVLASCLRGLNSSQAVGVTFLP